MRSYLTPKRNVDSAKTVRRVPIDGSVGVYRRDADDYAVVAETADSVVDLGVRDAAVSRKRDGRAPVELRPEGDGVRIRNQDSSNPISIRHGFDDQTLEEGESELVTGDCIIELGFATELRASVEADRDTLSKAELEELLGNRLQQGGAVMEGVSPAYAIRLLATNLRKSRMESVEECRKVATELKNFVAEHPVDDADYEAVRDDLERVQERLEAKSTGPLQGSDLDDQWHDEIDVLADRVVTLYGRAE